MPPAYESPLDRYLNHDVEIGDIFYAASGDDNWSGEAWSSSLLPPQESPTSNQADVDSGGNPGTTNVVPEAEELGDWLSTFESKRDITRPARRAYTEVSQNQTQSRENQSSLPLTRAWSSTSGKRSRGLREPLRSDSEEERRKLDAKKSKGSSTQTTTTFACPFYKRSPWNHQKYSSCLGAGLKDVHRVKQHLYKRHRFPEHRCLRCWVFFATQEELSAHQRSEMRCENSDPIPLEGITREQEDDLKAKRSSKGQDEPQKWKDLYMKLFPDDTFIPSPYAADPILPTNRPPFSATDTSREYYILSDFKDFLCNEGSDRFNRCLEHLNEHRNLGLSQDQTTTIQRLQEKFSLDLLQKFIHSRRQFGQADDTEDLHRGTIPQPHQLAPASDPANHNLSSLGSLSARGQRPKRSNSFKSAHTAPAASRTMPPPSPTSGGPSKSVGRTGNHQILRQFSSEGPEHAPEVETINPGALTMSQSDDAASTYGATFSFDETSQPDYLARAQKPLQDPGPETKPLSPEPGDTFDYGNFLFVDENDFTGATPGG